MICRTAENCRTTLFILLVQKIKQWIQYTCIKNYVRKQYIICLLLQNTLITILVTIPFFISTDKHKQYFNFFILSVSDIHNQELRSAVPPCRNIVSEYFSRSSHIPCKSKITEFDYTILGHEHIFGLHISMDYLQEIYFKNTKTTIIYTYMHFFWYTQQNNIVNFMVDWHVHTI